MKLYLLLLLVGPCVCAPLEERMQTGSCQDALALNAAGLAVTKINEDRSEGYTFALHRLANVNMMPHGDTGIVFYLTLDVVETDCHVLSKKEWKTCEARPDSDTPVYGNCKAAIYINRVNRVVRLYRYKCMIRPAPAEKVAELCPDCPSHVPMDDAEIVKTTTQSLEKFNKENGLNNHFALLNITRATSSHGMAVFYNVEYTVQETTCASTTDAAEVEKCPMMQCEFAHKGHCKASHSSAMGEEHLTVECDIFEPEASTREKKTHLLGGETDHSHTAGAAAAGDHDHVHDHTKTHAAHDQTHQHPENSEHHHEHDHAQGATAGHAHDHSHDHGHGHDHVHTHHAKAHDHSGDLPNQHHGYHAAGAEETHDHDHELALDHDHKHAHLHDHEHHHHHHEHQHEAHRHPEGMVIVMPALGQPQTLPSFPDQPVAGPGPGITLQAVQDPQIPGMLEPFIEPFPATISPECPAPLTPDQARTLVAKLFAEDPMFRVAA